MPVKTQFTTQQFLSKVPLPNYGGRYTVIPHSYIINQTRAELEAAGFTITQELYKATYDGKIAQGIYHLNYNSDPDMGLMFAWSNSYNKMMKFKCAVGAQVFICMNGVVSGDLANYKRKHTGTALQEATDTIKNQISNAKQYYNNLVEDKEMLKSVVLTKREQGGVLGQLFAEQEILTLTQVGIVKREMDKPTFSYNADPDSAWSLYNHITLALKESHPLNYLSDHQKLHTFFVNEFGNLTVQAPGDDDPQDQQTASDDYEYYPDVEATEEEVTSDFGVNFL